VYKNNIIFLKRVLRIKNSHLEESIEYYFLLKTDVIMSIEVHESLTKGFFTNLLRF